MLGSVRAQLEAGLLHQRKQVLQWLAAVSDGLELRGVLAVGIVGNDHRGASVLDVPLGELREQRGHVVAAHALEHVRMDLATGDLRRQRPGCGALAGVLVASGLGECRADHFLVEVLQRSGVRHADASGRRMAVGTRGARGGATAASRGKPDATDCYKRADLGAAPTIQCRHPPDDSHHRLRIARKMDTTQRVSRLGALSLGRASLQLVLSSFRFYNRCGCTGRGALALTAASDRGQAARHPGGGSQPDGAPASCPGDNPIQARRGTHGQG